MIISADHDLGDKDEDHYCDYKDADCDRSHNDGGMLKLMLMLMLMQIKTFPSSLAFVSSGNNSGKT